MTDFKQCVIDASIDTPVGTFCFCPIEGDVRGEYTVIFGLNVISSFPPPGMKLVAVIHKDGQAAVDKYLLERTIDFTEVHR